MTAPDARASKITVIAMATESLVSGAPVPAAPDEYRRSVGVVTRAISWVLDAVAINVVAIVAGLGAELVFSIFPVAPGFASVLKPIAGAAYVVWCGAYFVVFWSWTGQTLGARSMQIRLLTASEGRVRPVRALVRWIGMTLAMLPLFAGYAPLLVGRRGFPDWLAHTVVVEARQLSLARARMAAVRPTGVAVSDGGGPHPVPGGELAGEEHEHRDRDGQQWTDAPSL